MAKVLCQTETETGDRHHHHCPAPLSIHRHRSPFLARGSSLARRADIGDQPLTSRLGQKSCIRPVKRLAIRSADLRILGHTHAQSALKEHDVAVRPGSVFSCWRVGCCGVRSQSWTSLSTNSTHTQSIARCTLSPSSKASRTLSNSPPLPHIMPYGGNEINMSRKSPVPPSTTCTYSVYTPAPSEISVNRRWLNRIQEWTDEVPAGAEVTSSSSRPTTPASTPRSRFERHDSGKSLVSAVTTSSTVVPDDSISTRPTPMSKARQLPRDIPVQVIPGRSQLERLEPAKAAEIAREGDFRQTRPAQPAAYNDPRRTSYRSLVLDPISLTRTRLESPEITDRRHSDNRMTGRRSTYDSTIVPDDRFVRYSPTQLDYPSRSSQSRVLSPLGNERRPSQAELVKQEYRMSHEPSEEPNRPPTVRMDSGVSRSDSTRAPSPSYVMKAAHSHAPPPLPPKDASAAQYWTESHIKRLSEKAHPGGTRAGGKRDSWETTSVIDHRQERRVS